MNEKELELHRQLLAAFDEYIRLNLKWEEKGYRTDGRRARKALRKVMDIAYLRWQELLHRLHEMDVEKGNKPAERLILKDPGLAFLQLLHASKKRNQQPDLEEDDNTST